VGVSLRALRLKPSHGARQLLGSSVVQLILSNYGLRFIDHRVASLASAEIERDPTLRSLASLRRELVRPHRDDALERQLAAAGLVKIVGPELDREAVELRYRRNPLENIRRIVFEYTNVCNLACLHCRNGHLAPTAESKVEVLVEAVDLAVSMGVMDFHFIGGEVTLYGRRWLEVVEHIAGHQGTTSAVITSGWFLEETDFKAAGERYADDEAYLAALRKAGLDQVIFSVDGPEALHDRWRGVPGLYRRIMQGFAKVRAAGMTARVSIVLSDEHKRDRPEFVAWLAELADRVFPENLELPVVNRIQALLADEANYASNFIDVGNAVELKQSRIHIDQIPPELLRCKNFFRPHPSLRIQASGDLSLCPLIDSGVGYGNVHHEGLLHALNHLQERFVFKLHAERKIEDYLGYLDRTIFGEHVDHICSLRTIVTMLAKAIDERGVDRSDAAALRDINLEVARKAGWLPANGPVALGRPRPK
jgi:sulfatase maturation enzyme AslB (radical SAM superfamily)